MFDPENAVEFRGDRFYCVGAVREEHGDRAFEICRDAARRLWPELTWGENLQRTLDDFCDVGLVRWRQIYLRATVAEGLTPEAQAELSSYFDGACSAFH